MPTWQTHATYVREIAPEAIFTARWKIRACAMTVQAGVESSCDLERGTIVYNNSSMAASELLIEEVRKRPCLYDVSLNEYRDITVKELGCCKGPKPKQ